MRLRERERVIERQTDRQTDRQRKREKEREREREKKPLEQKKSKTFLTNQNQTKIDKTAKKQS